MINRYYSFFKSSIRKVLAPDWSKKLDKFEGKVARAEKDSAPARLRVLMGPSFAIYPPSYVIDRSLSYALRLRGVEIISMYCDGVQHTECNFFGGDWGGGEQFLTNCQKCRKASRKLWQHNPRPSLPLSKYLSSEEIKQISDSVSNLSFTEALGFSRSGIRYGILAKDILVNNYLVATPELVDDHENLMRSHLANLLMVSLAYERILDEEKPDRVISNDSYYGMWAILEQHCKSRGIPYYSHWPVTKHRVAFAYNDAAMNLDFTRPWPKFAEIPLTISDQERVDKWLAGGRGLVIDTTRLTGHEFDEPELKSIDPDKPALILAANVIWDLAALNKQILFEDMVEWIIETIEWFRQHKDFQLIIRPHPAETAPGIPNTRETVATSIKLHEVELPGNVFLLRSDAKVTFNELVSGFNVRGVLVHTTTVGFECPARGMPAITTARSPYRGFGFTIDPESRADYYACLNDLLSGDPAVVTEANQDLARRFIKYYQFHYYADTGLFVGNPPQIASNFEAVLTEDGPFEWVVDSIMQGLPINDESRWLPES